MRMPTRWDVATWGLKGTQWAVVFAIIWWWTDWLVALAITSTAAIYFAWARVYDLGMKWIEEKQSEEAHDAQVQRYRTVVEGTGGGGGGGSAVLVPALQAQDGDAALGAGSGGASSGMGASGA